MSQQQLSTKKVMNLSGAVVHEFSVNFNLILPEMSENIEFPKAKFGVFGTKFFHSLHWTPLEC